MKRRRTIIFLMLLAASAQTGSCAGAELAPGGLAPPAIRTNEVVRTVDLRGRVVCLAEEMHRKHEAGLPTRHEHIWGFKADDGRLYTLLRGRFSDAIWIDERLRAKELLVKARLFPKAQILEVQSIKSVRNGMVQDLYYYCEVCAIKSISPEPCACCQGPVELVEKPLTAKSEE
jgi:hypothetical protein